MDNCLKSVESSAQAINLAPQLRDLLSRGGFWLLKWFSNRPEVVETTPESERASSVLDLDLDKGRLPVERTLGLRWDMQKDLFIFDAALKSKLNTRRGILSLTSSSYDPLEFLAPIILPAKKLQDLCKERLDWDDPVGENESRRWEKWKHDLPKLSQLAVKRCVKPADLGKLKFAMFHHFPDA